MTEEMNMLFDAISSTNPFVIMILLMFVFVFMFFMSIGPAFFIVVKMMKKSNYHGDSSTEFRHLKGSRIKMFYTYETFLYKEFEEETKRLGIR